MFLTASNRFEAPTGKLLEPDDTLPASCYCKHKKKTAKKTSQIRSIALIFFLLACLYWLYKVYTNATGGLGHNNSERSSAASRTKLKLISVFNRHGDRSPSDSLPPGDEFAQRPKFFWPNGMSNLTDSGKFRQFRVGLELRKRYEDLLDYNASHYLAFSSPIFRCQESLEQTLRGLFDIEWPLGRGLKLIDQYNADTAGNSDCLAGGNSLNGPQTACSQHRHLILPGGSGSPLEFKQIAINTETLPMLTYTFLNNCKYRLEHPTPIDANLSHSEHIAQLKGIEKLKHILKTEYATGWAFEALGLFSTLSSEIRLARTRATINYGHRNFEWATQKVAEYAPAQVTLFDLYEEAAVLGYRDRIVGTARYIQLGPLISSMIMSQEVALGRTPSATKSVSQTGFDSAGLYNQKRAVVYSTHDSILQLLMHQLGLIRADDADFATRFDRSHRAGDVEQLMAGLRMCKFGMSLVFELYEMDAVTPMGSGDDDEVAPKFAFLQASLYNQEDGKYSPVEYKKLKLGKVCKQLFLEQNQHLNQLYMDEQFFSQEKFPLDQSMNCPFELFRNVTSDYLINSTQLSQLCST